ncbi:7-carboxy-7-deazaguanine synthase QueE [Anaerovibrio sp.]|uniref:7-carboxy-7-deazaguanine synthase QueE n=1 Tax=Anaerovibrio sp. TaxID=1872532 RepID=UPI003F16B494
MQANLIEVFSSVQGEGRYAGCRQLFVRFEGCNLQCRYCDTENAPGTHLMCNVEIAPGARRFREIMNPVEAHELAAYINEFLQAVPHQAVSFTGGEPLLQAGFLRELLPLVNCRRFLETNGTLPDRLSEILPLVDIISMDIKLPQETGREMWEEHERFLRLALEAGKDVYVKLVIPGNLVEADFDRAVKLVADVEPSVLLVLQPVTPVNGVPAAEPEMVLELQQRALSALSDVRVIPQTHRMMNQL